MSYQSSCLALGMQNEDSHIRILLELDDGVLLLVGDQTLRSACFKTYEADALV